MKRFILTLALAAALPLVGRADTRETTINGRTVTITTEVTSDTLAVCLASQDKAIDAQGWHDHILRSQEANKVIMVYSQRDNPEVATTKEVKVRLWKAISRDGKTYTETWTYTLSSLDVNPFLDKELPAITEQFKSAPIHYTIEIS